MEYEKPGILNTFLTGELYETASGFSSAVVPIDDYCGDDTCILY